MQQRKAIFYCLLGLLTLLSMASCALPPPRTGTAGATIPPPTAFPVAPTDTTSQIANTSWQLVSYGIPGSEVTVMADNPITLKFGINREVTGFGGCNNYEGTYQITGNQVTLGALVSTLRACLDQEVTQQELDYLAVLQLVGRFEVTAARLTLWYDDEQGSLTFVRASTPTTPIDETPVITPSATLTATETLTTTTATLAGL